MLVVPAGATDVVLTPHQAVYRMTLAPGSRTIDIAGADGVMIYRATRACGGWTIENHTVIRYTQADGDIFEDRWAFASWEADDGLSYRFRVLHQDGDDARRIEGTASLNGESGGTRNGTGGDAKDGVAAYTQPGEFEVDLPEGTLFPTAHLRHLIAAAKNNEAMLTKVVFDGTTEDNPYLVNIAVAPMPSRGMPLAQALGAPASTTYWTRGAYFPYFGDSELPDFEMTIEMRADGITERVEQYFHDLGLRGTLLSVELLQRPDC